MKEHKRDAWWFRPPTVESFAYIKIPNQDFRQKIEKVIIKIVGEHAMFNIQDKESI